MKKKIKKIKLFFLAFLGVCLGLTSFSSALEDSFFQFGLVDSNDNFISYQNESLFVPGNSYRLGYQVGYYDSSLGKNVWPIQSVVSSDSNWSLPWYKLDIMSNMFFDLGGSITIHGDYCQYQLINILSGSLFNNALGITVNYPDYWPIYFASGFVINSSNYNNYLDTLVFTNSCDFSINTTQDMLFGEVRRLFSFYNESSIFDILNSNYTAYSGSSVDCSNDSNYRQCLEDKNLLIGQVSTLSGSLSSCQSDLSDCMGGQDASLLACIDQKEQCESSLITLSGNYASLENMNSSLSSQLQECLESGGSGSSDLICNTFDLFWDSDDTRYSFPINNNLILPPGYKGFVNEGVLAIKQDNNNAYSISDEDFQNVMDSYGIVFLYLFGGALFLMFLFIMRKYFIGLKS